MGGHSPSAPPSHLRPQSQLCRQRSAARSWPMIWGSRAPGAGARSAGGSGAGARGAGGAWRLERGVPGGLRDWGKLCLALRCLWSGCCGADASGRAGDPPSHAGFSQPCYHRRCQWADAAGLVALTLPACAPCRQLWLIATHGRNCAATITPDSQKMRTGAAQPGSVVLALHTSEKQSDLQIFTFK